MQVVGIIVIGESKYSVNTLSFSTTSPTWSDLGFALGLCDEMPTNNRVRYGAAG